MHYTHTGVLKKRTKSISTIDTHKYVCECRSTHIYGQHKHKSFLHWAPEGLHKYNNILKLHQQKEIKMSRLKWI